MIIIVAFFSLFWYLQILDIAIYPDFKDSQISTGLRLNHIKVYAQNIFGKMRNKTELFGEAAERDKRGHNRKPQVT